MGQKIADDWIKDEVDNVVKDVFHDVVKQDVDDMVKNVVEDLVKEFGDVLDVEENQHKWEHWPSPASSQEMGLQCTKKDWSFFCSLKRQSIRNGWPFFCTLKRQFIKKGWLFFVNRISVERTE